MKLLLSAGSLYTYPLPLTFEIARDIGFAGVEVIINDDFEYSGGSDRLAEVAETLPIASLHAPFFDINGWGNKIQQLEKTVDLAIENGIPLVNFHPPVWLTLERKFWRWLNRVEDFQHQVGRDKVTLTIENMPANGPWGCNPHFLHDTSTLIDFMKQRNLFLTFDTAHMGTCRTNFLTDFHFFYDSGRIRNVHFSDYANGREHLLPGHGKLPLTRFLSHLRESGYDGTITLELTPHELPTEEDLIRESLAQVYNYLCDETRQSLKNAS